MKKLFCTIMAAAMLLTYGVSATAEAASIKVQLDNGDIQYTSWWYDLWHGKKKEDPPPPPPEERHHHHHDEHRDDHRDDHRGGQHDNQRDDNHGGPRR